MYKCKYCCKEFESPQKLGGHIIRCKGNPKAKDNIVKCNNFYNFNRKKRKKKIKIFIIVNIVVKNVLVKIH